MNDEQQSNLASTQARNDLELYQRLLRAEETAWVEFYDIVGPSLNSFFQWGNVRSPHDRDDLLNDTMELIFKNLTSFDPEKGKSLKAWARGFAKNVLNKHRETYNENMEAEELRSIEDLNLTINERGIGNGQRQNVMVNDREIVVAMREALNELSDVDKKIFMWGSDKNIPWRVIAEDVGLNLSATKMRYQRIKANLKEKLVHLV